MARGANSDRGGRRYFQEDETMGKVIDGGAVEGEEQGEATTDRSGSLDESGLVWG